MRNELTDRRELLSLAAGLALPRLVQAAPESPPRVEVVRVPHGGIQPQAVADPRGWVHLLYFLGDPSAGDLFYTRRPSGSPTWTAPLRVNRQPGCAVAVGSIRGGQLALGRRGQVHVVWNGSQAAAEKGPDGSAPVLYSRLLAAGRAFEPERNLMRRSRLLDGGASLAADGEGRVVIAWQAAPLVGSQAGGGAGAHRHGAGDGSASRRLFLTRSDDDGGAWSPEQPVDEPPLGACPCCGVRAQAGPGGRLSLFYRTAGAGVNRDMVLLTGSTRRDGFQSHRVDGWSIRSCPMSSATLVDDGRSRIAAWETRDAVYFGPVGPVGDPPAGWWRPAGAGRARKHPVLARNREGVLLLAWTEGAGWRRGGDLAWQVFDGQGRPLSPQERRPGGIPMWGLPAAVALADGSFLVIH